MEISLIAAILVALITAVVGPSILEWVKHILSKKKKNSLSEAIEINQMVDEQLSLILSKLNCTRVGIFQFHNGGHFYPTGKSIQKFSMFYEKLKINTASIQQTFQNIPVSLFSPFFAHLHKNGEVLLSCCVSKDHCNFKGPVGECNNGNTYFISLKDEHGSFIGVISINFSEDHEYTKEEYIFIREKVGMIGLLLRNYLYTQK
jgi:hypothetical protein